MITLRTLGAVGLTGEGERERELEALTRQPKRLAILIYLAAPHPGTWHRRETLLGIFWPDSDSTKARVALRNALYVIRQAVGPDLILTRGDEEIALEAQAITSDASQVALAVGQGDLAAALSTYGGEFLPGFYISDAGEFDRWVDGERSRLRSLATKAALQLSRQREVAGDLVGATEAMERLVDLDPDDETAVRRLITLLDRRNDHAQALAVFERLQTRLQVEFEAQPSRETLELVNAIRSRGPQVSVTRPVAIEPAAPPPPAPPMEVVEATRTPRGRSRLVWGALAALALIGAGWGLLRRPRSVVAASPDTLLVLPMVNETGNTADDYLTSGIADEVARHLALLGSLKIRSAAHSPLPLRLRDSLAVLGPAFGAQVVLRTWLTRVGDSLQVQAQVVDVKTLHAEEAGAVRFREADLPDAASRLAAQVAGRVFRVPMPELPRRPTRAIDPEGYRQMLLGWHRLLLQADMDGALTAFNTATQLAPMSARAWSGVSSGWASLTVSGQVSFDQGYPIAEAAARRALALDSLEGTAWANLGILNSMRAGDAAAGESYFARAFAAEPSNPEPFLIYAVMEEQTGHLDRALNAVRTARQLDPLSPVYAGQEARISFCAGRFEYALRASRTQLELLGDSPVPYLGVARALGALQRWDEAIASLRQLAGVWRDLRLADAIAAQHGESGYWKARKLIGEQKLRRESTERGSTRITPYLRGVLELGAGNIDRGMDLLEAELRVHSPMRYRLACKPDVDPARSSPRFQRLLSAIGKMSTVH